MNSLLYLGCVVSRPLGRGPIDAGRWRGMRGGGEAACAPRPLFCGPVDAMGLRPVRCAVPRPPSDGRGPLDTTLWWAPAMSVRVPRPLGRGPVADDALPTACAVSHRRVRPSSSSGHLMRATLIRGCRMPSSRGHPAAAPLTTGSGIRRPQRQGRSAAILPGPLDADLVAARQWAPRMSTARHLQAWPLHAGYPPGAL